MIRFQRSLQISQSKGVEATKWSKEVTAFLNGKYLDTSVQLFEHRFGVINTLVWHLDFDNLASLDKYQKTLNVDEEYLALVGKSLGLFMEGSLVDTVFETF